MDENRGNYTDLNELPFLMTPGEFASILRISKSKAYAFLAQCGIPTVEIGKQKRIRRDDFLEFVKTMK